MIVECRFSSNRKCKVIWESSEIVKMIRYSYKKKVYKEKEFGNFADANGFMYGLQKRGMKCELIEMGL